MMNLKNFPNLLKNLLLIMIIICSNMLLCGEIEELKHEFLSKNLQGKDMDNSLINNVKSLIPEINNLEDLKRFFSLNKKFIFEVYSPSCPHCIKFAPELEELAKLYQNKIKFIKTNGIESTAYRSIVKIEYFPALFIFDNGILIELNSPLNYNSVKKYIEDIYYFNCEKIVNKDNLIKIINSYSSNRFFIGILDSDNSNKAYEIFNETVYDSIKLVENCFYYVNYNNEFIYSLNKNYILVNDSKKLKIFEDIDYVINYPLEKIESKENHSLELAEVRKNLFKSFKSFTLYNSLPPFEEFKMENINRLMEFPKLRVIFVYDSNSKDFMMKMMNKFLAFRNNIENYTILFFSIENSKNTSKETLSFLTFMTEMGVHFTDEDFANKFTFNLKDLDISKLNNFAVKNSIKNKNLDQEKNNNIKSESQDNTKLENKDEKINKDKEKKYVTAKIVEKLDHIKNEKKEVNNTNGINFEQTQPIDKNITSDNSLKSVNNNLGNRGENKGENYHNFALNKIKILFIYLIIYGMIFYLFYVRITKKESDSKYN